MTWNEVKHASEVDDLPKDWSNYTLENKVQRLVDYIEAQFIKVRSGTFDHSNGEKVAVAILECQMTLSSFYADVEFNARTAKDVSDQIEAECQTRLAAESKTDKKPSDLSLKRLALTQPEVKDAKKKAAEAEKEYKKWRCVYEMLKDAHILFRNISRIQ